MTRLAPYAAALAGVLAASALIGAVQSVAPIGQLSAAYLLVVLPVSVKLGRGPAIFASATAFLIYDFFFTTPYHELTIAEPNEWVSLGLFLVTALITSEVAANERLRAEEARRREREAALLFDVVRLMTEPDLDRALPALAGRVRAELRVDAVGIELTIAGTAHSAAAGEADAVALVEGAAGIPTEVLPGARDPTATTSARPRRWVRVVSPRGSSAYEVLGRWRRYAVPVRVGDRTTGRIRLVRAGARSAFGPLDDRFLSLVATQLGLVSERAELELSATEAEVLRRANELKTALLNAVSHGLRTPLASILASAGSLRQREVRWDDADRDEFALAIEQQARHLDRIVGDLLDLSRVEAGALRPAKALHDLGALVDDAVARCAEGAEGRIVVRVPDDLPPVPLDPVEIDQVVRNLIENALKYAPPGSEIEVSASAGRGEVVVEVADRGPGIPSAATAYVFEPFYRVRGAGARPSGLGLGLAVAKGFVTVHGGRIWVEERDGGGATFGFALPAAEPEPVGAPEAATA